MPDNSISIDQNGAAFFTGPVVHAIDFGKDRNQALLAQYRDRRAIVADEQGGVVEIQNFYRSIAPKINAALAPFREGYNISVGIPWADEMAKNESDLGLGKVRVFNALTYHNEVNAVRDSGLPSIVVLTGAMTPFASLLKNSFSKVEVEDVDLNFPVTIAKIGASSFIDRKHQPGFAVAVFDSQNCQGRPSHWEYSVSLQFNIANLKDTCIQWLGEFDVLEDASFTFATVSDDGSGIWIDDVLVLDNNYLDSQAALRKEAAVALKKGHHKIKIQYSQWRGEAAFEGFLAKAGKEFQAIDATSFDSTVVAPEVESIGRLVLGQ